MIRPALRPPLRRGPALPHSTIRGFLPSLRWGAAFSPALPIRGLALLLLASAPAGAFELALPLDCALGENCFIQQYVDRDPGPGARDFTCGTLAYDRHEGTDFALPSLAAMREGVTVRAAAAGTVRGIRDGMPDIRISDPAAPPLEGRDCGNGVAITHDGGWETQYCHMKQGSIAVKAGDRVAAGAPLGQIGLSGNTEFPHLHVTVRQDGKVVDPFAPGDLATCGAGGDDLWQPDLAYMPGGLIGAGFAPAIPDFEAIKAGTVAAPDSTAPAMVFWAYLYGTRAGDTLRLALTGPEGEIAAQEITLDRTQAQSFRAIGRKLRGASWPAGGYEGEAVLSRAGAEIGRSAARLTLP